MRLPRTVLKADGLTLSPFHIGKAVMRKTEPPRSSPSDEGRHLLACVLMLVVFGLWGLVIALMIIGVIPVPGVP